MRPQSRNEFEIAIICALPLEADAVEALFDERYNKLAHIYGKQVGDTNTYMTGRIGSHNIVLAYMTGMGNRSSASVASSLRISFTRIKLALVVGICGGVPFPPEGSEIILGDVIISDSIIEYDYGRQYPNGFQRKSDIKETFGRPSQEIRSFLNSIRTHQMRVELQNQISQHLKYLEDLKGSEWKYLGSIHDCLFESSYQHKHYQQSLVTQCICVYCQSSQDSVCEQALRSNCEKLGCAGKLISRHRLDTENPQPLVHIGTIASASTVMKSGKHRDALAEKEGVIAFEMEGAGVWDNLPCIIIKGVCDYADSHKNKAWQNYAAAAAASCTKALLKYWASTIQELQVPDQPKLPFTVPFGRDEKFVGREDILTAIKETNQQGTRLSHKRAAVVGLGGVGKSQIAIEYTYRVRESVPNTCVFWVHSSNATRFEQAYREIGSEAAIPGWNDPKANILQLVNKWLCDKNCNWLMVLDNADDNNVFFDASDGNEPLADYLPQASNGSILITSRNKMAAQNLVGSYGNIITVEPMSTDDAVTLLETHIKIDQSSKNTARALVEALECIPLAITQAGAYISHRSPRITVSIYLELFQQSKSNQEKLMNYKGNEDIRRDKSIRGPVITTWQISFDQIRRIAPVATDLLSLMSMFDRQGIPEDLVNQNMDQLDFEDAVASLMSFSLIRTEIGEQSFEMHRLVQLSIRQWLKQHGQFYKWVQQSQQVMGQAFPSGDYGTWKTCQMLLPHLKEMIQLTVISDNEDPLNIIGIANRCGWYLFLLGKYREAEAMYRQALQGSKKALGAEHPHMLKSIHYLGNVLDSQGKYEEAEAMHRQALTGYEKVLGAEHPDTLRSVNSLANVLTKRGKLEDANAMHQQALAAREKLLGTEHPDTLRSVNNLGCVLRSQGKYGEAEAMYRRALTAREKLLGDEHPDTLSSVYSLANVLYSQGEYEEAEAVHRRALKGHEKVLGAEHPYTLNSINNLGNVLYSRGEYKEAEAMYRRALTVRKNVLGTEHPDTLSSIYSLDHVLYSQGKHKEDGVIHEEALT